MLVEAVRLRHLAEAASLCLEARLQLPQFGIVGRHALRTHAAARGNEQCVRVRQQVGDATRRAAGVVGDRTSLGAHWMPPWIGEPIFPVDGLRG